MVAWLWFQLYLIPVAWLWFQLYLIPVEETIFSFLKTNQPFCVTGVLGKGMHTENRRFWKREKSAYNSTWAEQYCC